MSAFGPITPLTPYEQATLYPYEAPKGAFLIKNGHVHPLDDRSVFTGRIAVLSVGSNRAPRQLFRKFGPDAIVPVTPAILRDFDICHVANIAPYGAIPCAAFFSAGTAVHLNVAWLDKQQLAIMHSTESLGDAYEFICWDEAQIDHEIDVPSQPIYGYASLEGMLPSEVNTPLGLQVIPVQHRQFQTASQQDAQLRAQQISGIGTNLALDEWILMMQKDVDMQDLFRKSIAASGLKSLEKRWTVMTDLLV